MYENHLYLITGLNGTHLVVKALSLSFLLLTTQVTIHPVVTATSSAASTAINTPSAGAMSLHSPTAGIEVMTELTGVLVTVMILVIFNTVVCSEQEALSVAVQPVHAGVGFMGGIVLISVSVSSSSDGIGDDVGKIKEQPGEGLFT